MHLRISHHCKIAVLSSSNPPTTTNDDISGAPFAHQLFSFRCSVCGEDNFKDMGMETAQDGRNPEKHFCREDAIKLNKFRTQGMWTPFIDVHHPELTCINENIVKVPSQKDQRLSTYLSRNSIVEKERSWLMKGESVGNFLQEFSTVTQYKDHFSKLVELESRMDEAECAAIPIMEDVEVVCRDTDDLVKWFEFWTKSHIHLKVLSRGQPISVKVERENRIQSHIAFINTHREHNGGVILQVNFCKRNIRSSDLEGAICIELVYRNGGYQRQLMALSNFAEDSDAVRNKAITAHILGSPVEKELKDLILDKYNGEHRQQLASGQALNTSQEQAVQMALNYPLSLIQGPPGTGKTHTIVAIVQNIVDNEQGTKVLCCAASNDPTDHLAVQLAKSGLTVTRIHSKRINVYLLPENIRVLTLCYKLGIRLGKGYKNEFNAKTIENCITEILENSQVICTTCNNAATPALAELHFANVIIDEATQATEPDALIPITKGCERLVLIGDQKQLGVLNKFRELEHSNRVSSLFERLIKLGQAPFVMLSTQYRMHPSICEPASQVIYNGLLKTDSSVAALRQSSLLNFISPKFFDKVFILDTAEQHEMASDGVSLLNGYEAVMVSLCLVNLLHRGVKPEDIGVITFYNGQKQHLKKDIKNHDCIPQSFRERLMIDSVDAFQGREKDFIILSCVRSGDTSCTSIGFLADQRRLNVALTRAKKGMIIVGNRKLLEKSPCWKKFLGFYSTVLEKSALLTLGVPTIFGLINCKYCLDSSQRSVEFSTPAHSLTSSDSLGRLEPLSKCRTIPNSDLTQDLLNRNQTAYSIKQNFLEKTRSPIWPLTISDFPALSSTSNHAGSNRTETPFVDLAVTKKWPKKLDSDGKNTSLQGFMTLEGQGQTRFSMIDDIAPLFSHLTLSSHSTIPLWSVGSGASTSANNTGTEVFPHTYIQHTSNWTDRKFHGVLKKYALSPSELNINGYPMHYSLNEGGCSESGMMYYKAKSGKIGLKAMSANLRNCERCKKNYKVDSTGNYLNDEECFYHWGKKQYQSVASSFSRPIKTFTYKCCNGDKKSRPCNVAPGHVSHTYPSMFDFVTTQTVLPQRPDGSIVAFGEDDPAAWSVLAMDCEMLYTTGGYELGRITLVNRKLECVYDSLVLPKTRVIDYNTRFSGLTAENFKEPSLNGVSVKTLDQVQWDLLGPIVHRETLLIGHSLESDLLSLKMIHNRVVDTSLVFQPKENKWNRPGLQTLVQNNLKKTIQDNSKGHDSFKDAAACMELMLLKLGKDYSGTETGQKF